MGKDPIWIECEKATRREVASIRLPPGRGAIKRKRRGRSSIRRFQYHHRPPPPPFPFLNLEDCRVDWETELFAKNGFPKGWKGNRGLYAA
ncbi:hypothetical protein LXL04_029110 [Taraxacum kok-saghyz]